VAAPPLRVGAPCGVGDRDRIIAYASLAGAPLVPFVDGAVWVAVGVLTVAQSVRYLLS
jgi:hypothetical protein